MNDRPERLKAFIQFMSAHTEGAGRAHLLEILNELAPANKLGEMAIERLLQENTRSIDDPNIDEQVARLVRNDVGVVAVVEDKYPRRLKQLLGKSAPPILFYRGNCALLNDLSVGFCGSRHASELGLEVCKDIVEQLVDHKATITAGYAAGVDQIAHRSALLARGRTIAVLAEGILNFSVRQILSDAWDWTRALVVSEYLPSSRWTVAKAMTRNRTIVGLSEVLVVIEARASGGTFEAGKAALALKHPLFAPQFGSISAEGNQILIDKGAIPLLRNRSSGRANISPVLELLKGSRTTEQGV